MTAIRISLPAHASEPLTLRIATQPPVTLEPGQSAVFDLPDETNAFAIEKRPAPVAPVSDVAAAPADATAEEAAPATGKPELRAHSRARKSV